MYFVSFQPYDWKTAIREKDWRDLYSDILGFNPMYCIPAEQLDIALINACFIVPTTPEVAVWFKTNDFWVIDKIEHYKLLDGKSKESIPISGNFIKQKSNFKSNRELINFLINYKPFDLEYLVNKNEINIIKEVDIIKTVTNAFADCVSQKDTDFAIQHEIETQMADFVSSKHSKWMTKERVERNATAFMYYYWYTAINDSFINDYKKIIGMKRNEQIVTTERIKSEKLDFLVNNFGEHPTDKNKDAFINYMKSVIYRY